MLGNRLAICMFFYSKNPNIFASARLPVPFLKAKLTQTKQLIDCGLAQFTVKMTNSEKAIYFLSLLCLAQ